MKRLLTALTLLALSSAPALAREKEVLPYRDGTIPEEEQNTEQAIRIQDYRNTVYFEGFLLYYTQNRFNIVTRYKPPACPGGRLDTAFYTQTATKYGFVITPEHVVRPSEQTQEYTFSSYGYIGPLDEAKVKLHVRSSCVLQPHTPAVAPEVLPELKPLPKLPELPQPLPKSPAPASPAPVEVLPLTQQEIFKQLVPQPTPMPETLELLPESKPSPDVKTQTQPQPLAPLPKDHPLLR